MLARSGAGDVQDLFELCALLMDLLQPRGGFGRGCVTGEAQSRAADRLLALIEQHHNLLVRYLLPDWAQFGVMDDWGPDETELVVLCEQRRIREAAEWLREDLGKARKRVIQPVMPRVE